MGAVYEELGGGAPFRETPPEEAPPSGGGGGLRRGGLAESIKNCAKWMRQEEITDVAGGQSSIAKRDGRGFPDSDEPVK